MYWTALLFSSCFVGLTPASRPRRPDLRYDSRDRHLVIEPDGHVRFYDDTVPTVDVLEEAPPVPRFAGVSLAQLMETEAVSSANQKEEHLHHKLREARNASASILFQLRQQEDQASSLSDDLGLTGHQLSMIKKVMVDGIRKAQRVPRWTSERRKRVQRAKRRTRSLLEKFLRKNRKKHEKKQAKRALLEGAEGQRSNNKSGHRHGHRRHHHSMLEVDPKDEEDTAQEEADEEKRKREKAEHKHRHEAKNPLHIRPGRDELEVAAAEEDKEKQENAGDGDEAKKEEGEEEEEEEDEEPCRKTVTLSLSADVKLQTLWLAYFICIILGLTIWGLISHLLISKPPPGDTPDQDMLEPTGEAGGMEDEDWLVSEPILQADTGGPVVELLFSFGVPGFLVSMFVMLLSILNFYSFAVVSEERALAEDRKFRGLEQESEPEKYQFFDLGVESEVFNAQVEKYSFPFLAAITACRLVAVIWHPKWRHFGFTAPFRYMIGNFYMAVELLGLIATCVAIRKREDDDNVDHVNFLFLFFFRILEVLQQGELGSGLTKLVHVVYTDRKLLRVCFLLVVATWLPASGAYWVANKRGAGEDEKGKPIWPDTSTWECYQEKGPGPEAEMQAWVKFQSIPSSMWFVLLNLAREHPLADAHETLVQRSIVCTVVILAVPVFALPCSVLQNALLKITAREQEVQKAREALEADGGGPDPGTLGAAAAALGLANFFDEPKSWVQGDEDCDAQEESDSIPGVPKSMEASKAAGIAESAQSWYWQAGATLILTLISVYTYFAYTARDTPNYRYLFIDLRVSARQYACVDSMVGIIFFFEWIRRLQRGVPYVLSVFFLFDVLAFLPSFIHAFVFFYIGRGEGQVNPVLCACVVLRMFKMEKFTGAFRMAIQVMYKERALLLASFVVTAVTWMLFSVLFYISERGTADTEMFENYGSVMRSTWAEVINLHGEYPWADYSSRGKALGTVCAFFAIMLFSVPISICGNGFQEMLKQEQIENADTNFDREPWQHRFRPRSPGISQTCYDLLYIHLQCKLSTPWSFKVVRAILVVATFASMLVTIGGTVEDEEMGNWRDPFHTWGWRVDFVTVIIFGGSIFLNIMALGTSYIVSLPGLCDVLSTFAIVSTLRCEKFRKDAFHPKYNDGQAIDDSIVFVRALRLFTLETYFHGLHTLQNVIYLNRWPLFRALWLMVTAWYLHATLLYLCEHHADPDGRVAFGTHWHMSDEEINKAAAETSAEAALVQLIGNMTFHAEALRHLAVTAGAAHLVHTQDLWLPGASTSLAQALGFSSNGRGRVLAREPDDDKEENGEAGQGEGSEEAEEDGNDDKDGADSGEEEGEEEEMTMADRYASIPRALQYSIVHLSGDFPETDYHFWSKVLHFVGIVFGIAIIATFCGVFTAAFVEYLNEERRLALQQRAKERVQSTTSKVILIQRYLRRWKEGRLRNRAGLPARQVSGAVLFCRSVCTGDTTIGMWTMRFFNLVLLVDLVDNMLKTIPQFKDQPFFPVFGIVESVCTLIFIIEFVIRVVGAPRGRVSKWRILDLICLLPGVAAICVSIAGEAAKLKHEEYPLLNPLLKGLTMGRAFRLLDFPFFNKEVNIMLKAIRESSMMLAVPAYAALNVWIMFSCGFMWTENYYAGKEGEIVTEAEHMKDVPASMYWTCIFLLGEWANVDFTYAGSRLSILTVFIGVALFSVPVGILVEAVQSTLEQELAEEDMQKQILDGDLGMDDIVEVKTRLDRAREESSQRAPPSSGYAPPPGWGQGGTNEPLPGSGAASGGVAHSNGSVTQADLSPPPPGSYSPPQAWQQSEEASSSLHP